MDKTDLLWYNTAMNNVAHVRSGSLGKGGNMPSGGKFLTVICPDAGDKIEITSGGSSYSLSGGQVAVISPLCPFVAEGGSAGAITVCIEQPLLSLKGVRIFGDAEGGGIRKAAEQAAVFFGKNGCGQILNALGQLIACYITSLCDLGAHTPVVISLKEDIESGAGDCTYSVEAAMRRLPLNYDYVRKLFKKEMGLTPHEYLVSVRMERAGNIILSGISNRYSSFTVGQIAEACGYAEPLYFSRAFKNYFGVSPTEYSKTNKR